MINRPEINNLPRSVSTLKSLAIRHLPLLDMRYKSIPLIPEKLATDTATRKALGIEGDVPHENVFVFDPQSLFKAFLSSDIAQRMHHGFAEFHDEPSELWRCWSSSVRTTSGQYAHCRTPSFDPQRLGFCSYTPGGKYRPPRKLLSNNIAVAMVPGHQRMLQRV
jgi:hypothetical protein